MNELMIERPVNALMHRMWHEIDHMMGHPDNREDGVDFHPAADIRTVGGGIEITLELPGVRKEDLHIEVEEGHLVVKGAKSAPVVDKEGPYLSAERVFGRFHRIVHLPQEANLGKVAAEFRDGVLTVTIPCAALARPEVMQIPVS
jgi:HSP20 family protein